MFKCSSMSKCVFAGYKLAHFPVCKETSHDPHQRQHTLHCTSSHTAAALTVQPQTGTQSGRCAERLSCQIDRNKNPFSVVGASQKIFFFSFFLFFFCYYKKENRSPVSHLIPYPFIAAWSPFYFFLPVPLRYPFLWNYSFGRLGIRKSFLFFTLHTSLSI